MIEFEMPPRPHRRLPIGGLLQAAPLVLLVVWVLVSWLRAAG